MLPVLGGMSRAEPLPQNLPMRGWGHGSGEIFAELAEGSGWEYQVLVEQSPSACSCPYQLLNAGNRHSL